MSTRTAAIRWHRLGLFALVLCAVEGCSGSQPTAPASPISGTLTWQNGADAGELEGGKVEFAEMNGSLVATADILSDGTFSLATALPTGKYRVRVVPPAGQPGGTIVAQRFLEFESSGLTINATAEPQVVRFKLDRRR